ncbi:hypothetical protein GCM10027057_01990 [Marisediminicola antarctica]
MKELYVDISLLRHFVQVVDTLDFERAAAALAIPRSSLNASIRQLEAEVGTPLFIRVDGSVTLTPAGEAIVDDARAELANPTPKLPGSVRKASKPSAGGKAKASKGKGRAPAVKGQSAPGKRRQSR